MFRLEKVFQNDDKGFIYLVNIFKTFIIFSSLYIFSILKENSIYDMFNYKIFINSSIYQFIILLTLFFFLFSFVLKDNYQYDQTFFHSFRKDLLVLSGSNFLILILGIFLKDFFYQIIIFFLINFIIIVNLFLTNIIFNYVYNFLIDKNIIQRNIMLVGNYFEVQKIINSKLDHIYIFKCCIITDIKNHNNKIVKSVIKLPIFGENEDIRTILEYHHLGQIWILNAGSDSKEKIYKKIINFSVDTLNVKLNSRLKKKTSKRLINNLYQCEYFQKSNFYGMNLLFKIIIDKLFSIFLLFFLSPIFIFAAIIIYFEDGLPIIFIQNRTGWDGRRFKIYKLRSLKKSNFDRTVPVKKNDERLLKCGKFLRRWGIDEYPQFLNVLKGDMSLVGPKPHMVEHDLDHSSNISNILKRYKCSPGITGWAQVHGIRNSGLKSKIIKKRIVYDLWYLRNWNIFLDFYIIFITAFALIKYKGDED